MKKLSELSNEYKVFESSFESFKKKHGIEEKGHGLGFSEKEQKWYGWTHRGCCAFGIGDEERECYPGETKIGKKCKTLDDCKQAAIKFMKSIS